MMVSELWWEGYSHNFSLVPSSHSHVLTYKHTELTLPMLGVLLIDQAPVSVHHRERNGQAPFLARPGGADRERQPLLCLPWPHGTRQSRREQLAARTKST